MKTGPGVVFGVIVLIVSLLLSNDKKSYKRMFFVLASLIAYYFAFNICVFLISTIHIIFALLISGFIGATILLIGFKTFIYELSNSDIFKLSLIGSILALSYLTTYISNENSMLILFCVWQTGMAAALGWVIDKKQSSPIKEIQDNSQQNTNNN